MTVYAVRVDRGTEGPHHFGNTTRTETVGTFLTRAAAEEALAEYKTRSVEHRYYDKGNPYIEELTVTVK